MLEKNHVLQEMLQSEVIVESVVHSDGAIHTVRFCCRKTQTNSEPGLGNHVCPDPVYLILGNNKEIFSDF